MNERSVQPIGSVRAFENGWSVKGMASNRVDASPSHEHAGPDIEQSVKQTESEKRPVDQILSISIHFNVDEETNRLLVVVTDRQSGRVLRTIPASELEKLQAGDLLKLRV